ncbi:ABC transporter ATP-binding protein [Paeniglutamicibacter sp. MACA_103]|uniref:ABC transporter ATP-binding protein n=1 Tax=Paeniglutamicibacter sp. MACA_103 TaxID=3377337 RepID=UPI003895AD53
MTSTTHVAPATSTSEDSDTGQALDIWGLNIGYGAGPDVVSDVNLRVAEGEIVGIIGESGCGKSSVGLALLGLLPAAARTEAYRLRVAGKDLVGLGERELARIRGNDVSMIFQEPMSALNPVIRIGDQISEVLLLHGERDKRRAAARALELLTMVQVPEPELRMRQYPHQMSGGMRQRVMIAIAMAANPRLLVADEPTTALDVTVQAQILALLTQLRDKTGMGMVLISHDLGVIASTCDRVAVMYAGQIVEEGTPKQVMENPAHPYTRGLLASIPRRTHAAGTDLPAIIGGIRPEDRALPGCRFAARCPMAEQRCLQPQHLLDAETPGHTARCVLSTRGLVTEDRS